MCANAVTFNESTPMQCESDSILIDNTSVDFDGSTPSIAAALMSSNFIFSKWRIDEISVYIISVCSPLKNFVKTESTAKNVLFALISHDFKKSGLADTVNKNHI